MKHMRRTGIKKRGLLAVTTLICMGMLLGGCGEEADEAGSDTPAASEATTVKLGQYEEPPQIELLAVGEEGNQFAVPACSYSWNCQTSENELTGSIADAPHPLETKSQMVTLAGDGTEAQYRFVVPAAPDELDIWTWELTDIGNKDAQQRVNVDAVYYKEETEAENFTVSLEAGKVYEFFLEWKQEGLAENGFYGIASYVFKTAVPAVADGQEPERSYGVILPETGIVSFRVKNTENGASEERGVYSSDSGFEEVMAKYKALDIKEDENQQPGENFLYQMNLLDWNGQKLQTLDFSLEELFIDGVRYRSTGTGTVGELFLAVDMLFDEDVPEAVFGEAVTEEPDLVDGLEMTASYVTPKGINLVFTNHTGKEAMFGDDYELQAWKDNAWHQVEYVIDNAAFHMIGYPISGQDPACWKVKWTYFHGVLPAGSYRITKSVSIGEGEASEDYLLAAEFSVE